MNFPENLVLLPFFFFYPCCLFFLKFWFNFTTSSIFITNTASETISTFSFKLLWKNVNWLYFYLNALILKFDLLCGTNLKQNKKMGIVSKTGSRPGSWAWEKADSRKYGSLGKTRPEELQTYTRPSQVIWKAISKWFIFT